jgi:hypothetical protein
MDDFAHLSVLLSIVLGLGVTNLLTGLARIVQMRTRVKHYWPTYVWVITLLLIHVQTWWAMFGLRTVESWTFFAFLITLMQPVLLFFLSALVLPDFDREELLDLRANHFAQTHWFFGIFMTLAIVSLARNYAVTGHLQSPADLTFHLVFFIGFAAGATFANETFHKVLALVAAGVFFTYVTLLFAALM